jgi:hypothetical protein
MFFKDTGDHVLELLLLSDLTGLKALLVFLLPAVAALFVHDSLDHLLHDAVHDGVDLVGLIYKAEVFDDLVPDQAHLVRLLYVLWLLDLKSFYCERTH